MFWIIETVPEKRRPNDSMSYENFYLNPMVFQNPEWTYSKPFGVEYNGEIETVINHIGYLSGEKIERKLNRMIKVKLCRSKRTGKQVKRITILYDTLRYWDIINAEFNVYGHSQNFDNEYLQGLCERMDSIDELSTLDNKAFNALLDVLKEKIKAIIEEFKTEYKGSVEYYWLRINQQMKVDNLETDRKKQAKYEKEEQAKEKTTRDNWNQSTGSQPAIIPPVVNNGFIDEIIKAGYRTLARKYHPDSKGTHDDFIKLSAAKDILTESTQKAINPFDF